MIAIVPVCREAIFDCSELTFSSDGVSRFNLSCLSLL